MLDTISMAEKLNGDYRKAFEKADMYSTVAGGEEEVTSEKIMNLFDLLMQAQYEEKPIEKVIGKDIEEFCMNYFKQDEETKEKWYIVIPKAIYGIMKVVAVWTVLFMIPFEETDFSFDTKQNISPYIMGVLLGLTMALVGNEILKKFILKSRKIKPLLFYCMIVFGFVGGVIISVMISDLFIIEISTLHLLFVSFGYVTVYFLIRSIWRYKKFGTIRKETKEALKQRKDTKKQEKAFNKEMSDEAIYHIMVDAMAKRYLRFRKKKGISFSEFAEKIRKEQRQAKQTEVITIFVYVVIVVVLSSFEMINNNVYEGLIYGLLLVAVEIPIYLFTKKTVERNCQSGVQIIEDCERKGVDIVEYLKELKENKEDKRK